VALLLASGFGLGRGLLLSAGRFVLFLRFLFISFDNGGVQCLRINFIEACGIRQWVVVFVYGRSPGSADEHGLKDGRRVDTCAQLGQFLVDLGSRRS
jgi:hypothetical protein